MSDDLIPRPLVERDQWELAFEPFVGETYAALRLALTSRCCGSTTTLG